MDITKDVKITPKNKDPKNEDNFKQGLVIDHIRFKVSKFNVVLFYSGSETSWILTLLRKDYLNYCMCLQSQTPGFPFIYLY